MKGVIGSGLSGSSRSVKGLPKGVTNAGLGEVLESECLRVLVGVLEGDPGFDEDLILEAVGVEGGTCVRFFFFWFFGVVGSAKRRCA